MSPSRRMIAAVGLSLLAHLLAAALPLHPPTPPPATPMAAAPLTVRIVQPPEPRPEPAEVPAPTPPPAQPRPPPPRREPVAPRVIAPRPPPPLAPPAPPAAEEPPPPPPPAPSPPAPTMDMLAMIEARRARREQPPPAPPPVAKPAEDPATRNLATLTGREGVGGVFSVLHVGPRTGKFEFRGWRPEARNQWHEVIEVDAGLGGNVELAMVRRMIELIRTHYTGDFNWESHRLGRLVVLSARPEHTAELEDFLMREFFGTPTLNPRRRAP